MQIRSLDFGKNHSSKSIFVQPFAHRFWVNNTILVSKKISSMTQTKVTVKTSLFSFFELLISFNETGNKFSIKIGDFMNCTSASSGTLIELELEQRKNLVCVSNQMVYSDVIILISAWKPTVSEWNASYTSTTSSISTNNLKLRHLQED